MQRDGCLEVVKNNHLVLFMCLLALTVFSGPLPAAGSSTLIPGSGQILCYGLTDGTSVPCAGTGQDADASTGVPLPSARFSVGADGAVVDNLTGLLWNPDGSLMVNRDPAFDTDGIANDGKVTWYHALEYIRRLNDERYLGHSDWRLPNISELSSLMDAGRTDLADWLAGSGIARIARDGYWSSTSAVRNPTYAWLFSMKTMQITYAGKDAQYHLLAVCSGQPDSGYITLPQTGQQKCYDAAGSIVTCSGAGQDGDSQTGVPLPASRFTPNSDTTLSDRLTGLAWAPSGNAPGPAACAISSAMAWSEALGYVACLNSNRYLGHDDWRLPNVKEMQSLIDFGRSDMSAYLNTSGFTEFTLGHYWTSTSVAYASRTAWIVHLSGATFTGDKTSPNRVIPVRGEGTTAVHLARTGQRQCFDSAGNGFSCSESGQDGELLTGLLLPEPRYSTAEDGTVTDPLTGLVWAPSGNSPGPAACSPGTPKNWMEALAHVACLNANSYLGHADWRLPNVWELLSLFDFGRTGVASYLNSAGFTDFPNYHYWTSTSVPYAPQAAWLVHFSAGTFTGQKTSAHLLIPVRSGINEPDSTLGLLAQSGQQFCYDTNGAVIGCTGTGQDGESRSGVFRRGPRFALNPDGAMLDRLTDLNWAPDGDVMTTRDALFDEDGTAADGKVTWQHAIDYIRKLNTEGYLGYNDWRLPNINELASLTHAGSADMAAWLSGAGFAHVAKDGYWTSTSMQSNPTYAWLVQFGSQQLTYAAKDAVNRVFPVRGGYSGDAAAILSPAALEFGLIDLAVVNRSVVEISNSSAATLPLVVRSVSILGPQATSYILSSGGTQPCALGSVPFSLPPGSKCTVAVDFVPQIAGSNLATLRVTTANTPTPYTNLPLSGSVVDTFPPTSRILSPLSGAAVRGTSVVINGTAKDLTGVALVEVSTDGGASWNSAVGRESWNFTWTPALDGEYSLMVRATDTTGLVQTAVTGVSVTIDTTQPLAVFVDPVGGSTVSAGTILVTGTAMDTGTGVQLVELSTDGGTTWKSAIGTTAWSYAWPVPAAGGYTLLVRAVDRAGNVQPTPTSVTITADMLTFTLPNGRLYPVLWPGQTISASAPLTLIETFTPTFGSERKNVNPVMPTVDGATLTFTVPGEYYLKLNGTHFLKVLVLSPREPISSHVMRIFNFCVANMFHDSEDDNAYYSGKTAYLNWWFHNPSPARLLCGPTQDFFNMIIKDALSLPTRKVTFPGVFRYEGQIYKSTHNILEVYLPDIGKWTLFDINYGFVVRWMDAFDLVDFARANSSGSDSTGFWAITDALINLDIPKDTPVPYLAKHNDVNVGQPYSSADLSSIPMSFLWKEVFRFYYSGLAYWGSEVGWQKPTGTEFLAGQYILANRHTDPVLEQEAVSWVESLGLSVTRVSQDSLAAMLAAGFSAEIAAQAWLQRIPQ